MIKANEKKAERRITYSLDPDRARDLAREAINLAEELERSSVPRQMILDALVECLKDKAVYSKVKSIIKNKKYV